MEIITIPYYYKEIPSHYSSKPVRRYFFGNTAEHKHRTAQITRQLTEYLGWFAEHMVLPTKVSEVVEEWLKAPVSVGTKSTIPADWIDFGITQPKSTWYNAKTGNTKATQPCPLGVIGGLVRNLQTQRELTEPQIKAIEVICDSMNTKLDGRLPEGLRIIPPQWVGFAFTAMGAREESNGPIEPNELFN